MATDLTQLTDRIARLRPGSGRRSLVAVSGAPGSGKSHFSKLLSDALNALDHLAKVLPMDGFHLDNTLLDAQGLRPRKGAPDTFDVAGLARTVAALQTDPTVYIPLFDRARDLSIACADVVPPDCVCVICEGNYLLADAAPWDTLAPFWDLTVHLDVPDPVLRQRLVQRWLDHGLSQSDAEHRADSNDMRNARWVTETLRTPDLTVKGTQ